MALRPPHYAEDVNELALYVDAWSAAADDLLAAAAEITPQQWEAPSDCPGWSARDVLAHVAAIECELATGATPSPLIPIPGRPPAAWWIASGVAQRRGMDPAAIADELREAVQTRREQYAADPPTDPDARPPRTIGNLTWDTRTLLRNRVVDMWVHDQDIRRAVGLPPTLDTPGADVVALTFAAGMPYVIGRKVAPPTGTCVRVVIDDTSSAYVIDADGRCVRAESDEARHPVVTLTMNRAALTLLGAGRRTYATLPPDAVATIEGERELGIRILDSMSLTP